MPRSKANTEPLSKAQEEEMSSALIAKLLAEDDMLGGGAGNDYYAEYSNDTLTYERYKSEDDDESYEDDSEDEGYKPKRSSNGKGRGRGRPPKAAAAKDATLSTPGKRGRKRKTTTDATADADPAQTAADGEAQQKEGTGSSTEQQTAPEQPKSATKKPRRPVPEGFNTGVYTEEEEKKFLEALEMFGRDWNKVTAHIGTRDAHSIRSHAQKHFIKLYRDNIPLPAKVRESGEGYTLSGKPLDPDSAAAKPYLSRGKGTTKENDTKTSEAKDTAADTNGANGSTTQEKPNTSTTESDKSSDPVKTAEALAVGENGSNAKSTPSAPPPKNTTKQNRKSPAKSRNSSPTKSNIPTSAYEEDGRTSYSKKRLRQTRERTTIPYNQLGKDQDPLTMIKCEPFSGEPGSNISGCQPFALQVHSNVLLAMDFHAHLMSTEIIGFLAGSWDKKEKRICIKEAFPCRSLNTGQNDVNVEMDPTSAIETRQLIEEKNMVVVGWYHSHPTFAPDPSIIDIENQRNYQTLCREKCGGEDSNGNHTMPEFMEPFVGAIIGPYDPRLPGSSSVINWFYVGDSRNTSPAPKRLHYELKEDDSIPDEYAARLFALLDEYKSSPEKVDFAGLWRQESDENKLDKVTKSLGGRMPWIKQQLNNITSKQREEQQEDAAANNKNNDSGDGVQPMEVDSGDAEEMMTKPRAVIADPFLTRVREALQHW